MSDDLPRSRLTSHFERRVARIVAAHVAESSTLVVACSAGPDSTAALIACARARGGSGELVAAYFDHGMRPSADTEADRAAVAHVARQVGARVAFGSARRARPIASEAAAREERYRWLASVCIDAGADRCITGHTLDDQAETVLLRLTRGAGLSGVSAMAVEAPWPVSAATAGLRLLRPLLGMRRLEVLTYLGALDVEPRLDATNELLTFHRNRIRHRVLPQLRAVNPRVDEALARFAGLARRDDEALEAWARRELPGIARIEEGCTALDRRALRGLPPAVASRVLRLAAARAGLSASLEHEQVEAMLRLAGRRGARLSFSGGEFVVEGGDVLLRRPEAGEQGD